MNEKLNIVYSLEFLFFSDVSSHFNKNVVYVGFKYNAKRWRLVTCHTRSYQKRTQYT